MDIDEWTELDDRLVAAINRMITAALPMVAASENIAEAARRVVVQFHRFDPIARMWRREQARKRTQAYLNTRRTSRRD